MRKLAVLVMAVMLSGCVHWQDFNPFHKEEPPAPVEVAAPVEKIGPDVIAVPVEPVEAEDMLQATPPDAGGL